MEKSSLFQSCNYSLVLTLAFGKEKLFDTMLLLCRMDRQPCLLPRDWATSL